LPAFLFLPLVTDGEGQLVFTFNGGGGPVDLYLQYLISDPGATQGISISNAVQAVFQP
jgi:hypothetical protein